MDEDSLALLTHDEAVAAQLTQGIADHGIGHLIGGPELRHGRKPCTDLEAPVRDLLSQVRCYLNVGGPTWGDRHRWLQGVGVFTAASQAQRTIKHA
jgi:hypothetical protein